MDPTPVPQQVHEEPPAPPKTKKRNTTEASETAEVTVTGRSKRGKYTSVAWNQHIQTLTDELSQLRQQVSDLMVVVKDLKEQTHEASTVSSHSRDTFNHQSPSSTQRRLVPKQPQFVGPTRSAFSILVSEKSLNRMGVPRFDSMPPSGAQSPMESVDDRLATDVQFWDRCTASDITKYLVIFQEEIESVYPFIDIGEYVMRSHDILHAIQHGLPVTEDQDTPGGTASTLSSKDIAIVRLAVATGIVLEDHGTSDLSTAIADSVETKVSSIRNPQVDLKDIQLLTMLSIYYFHSGEELLSWRTIGIAARETLEMGLHRRRSLLDNFKDPDSRRLATRVFWCVYVLDRRWSFGTSLSFALVDKDVDPELPKPDEEYLYLKCMVGYGQLCSKLWDAIPPFGSASQIIPEDTATALDLYTQDWLDSIPPHLRLRHPRLGLAPRAQPRLAHRLRALLYLRGNYARILIYRHHLMSTASITANPQSAWLVVDIAQDTIQVLVHLHSTTDIYSRQQNAFNYFLLGALAVIFLAVSHAPETFAAPCRKTFLEGVNLVRGLSRHNVISRRLWNSIRGLIPRMKTLGLPNGNSDDNETIKDGEVGTSSSRDDTAAAAGGLDEQMPIAMSENDMFPLGDMVMPDTDFSSSVPDMYQMRDDLMSLFDAFGQGQHFVQPIPSTFDENGQFPVANEQEQDISMRFQGLI
ncbi:hypothetical protein F66182_7532 [Fusarium sp. NRRL 66182]|nr:hypothetical protein F66182_7532 [Fusarium sp. NRRL 66182]